MHFNRREQSGNLNKNVWTGYEEKNKTKQRPVNGHDYIHVRLCKSYFCIKTCSEWQHEGKALEYISCHVIWAYSACKPVSIGLVVYMRYMGEEELSIPTHQSASCSQTLFSLLDTGGLLVRTYCCQLLFTLLLSEIGYRLIYEAKTLKLLKMIDRMHGYSKWPFQIIQARAIFFLNKIFASM